MTFQTYETGENQINVLWTYGGKLYYIHFADWTIQPGEILMRVLQDCGVSLSGAAPAEANPAPKENIFLAVALSKTPSQAT